MPPINVEPRVGLTISYGLRTVEIRDSKWDDVRVALFLRNPTWMSTRTPRTGFEDKQQRECNHSESASGTEGEKYGALTRN